MSPTMAPNFLQLSEYGDGCPEDFKPSNHYETGDAVSYAASPDRQVVYECKVGALLLYHVSHSCNENG